MIESNDLKSESHSQGCCNNESTHCSRFKAFCRRNTPHLHLVAFVTRTVWEPTCSSDPKAANFLRRRVTCTRFPTLATLRVVWLLFCWDTARVESRLGVGLWKNHDLSGSQLTRLHGAGDAFVGLLIPDPRVVCMPVECGGVQSRQVEWVFIPRNAAATWPWSWVSDVCEIVGKHLGQIVTLAALYVTKRYRDVLHSKTRMVR